MKEAAEQVITVIVVAIVVALCLIVFAHWWDSSQECEKKGGAYIQYNCVQVIK